MISKKQFSEITITKIMQLAAHEGVHPIKKLKVSTKAAGEESSTGEPPKLFDSEPIDHRVPRVAREPSCENHYQYRHKKHIYGRGSALRAKKRQELRSRADNYLRGERICHPNRDDGSRRNISPHLGDGGAAKLLPTQSRLP